MESVEGAESNDHLPDTSIKDETRSVSLKFYDLKRFTKRQWICLMFFGLTNLLSSMMVSLQAPFYPAEAELKGATATEYGLVFGIFEFIIFLTSPIFGKYMNKIGPKEMYTTSIVVTSIACCCFGLLDRIDDHTWFITLSFICRIIESLGTSGFITATTVFIAVEFPDSFATTFASLETVIGLGFITGPTIGAFLYELGGFPLPFFVVGGCLFVTGIISCLLMPKMDKATTIDGAEDQGYNIWTILKIPAVFICAISIISAALGMGFVTATLEPHIRQFGLTPIQVGLVFIVSGGIYAVTAPLFGYLCDYVSKPMYISVAGNFLSVFSFLLLGPADFLPFDTILWVTIIGLVLQGLGQSCIFVSSFLIGVKECLNSGLPDNLSTYGVISGLYQSMISLGAWIGPSAGGFLFDIVGFRDGSWFIIGTSFIAGVASLLHTCLQSPCKDLESQPLLSSQREHEHSQSQKRKKGSDEENLVKPSTSSYGSTS